MSIFGGFLGGGDGGYLNLGVGACTGVRVDQAAVRTPLWNPAWPGDHFYVKYVNIWWFLGVGMVATSTWCWRLHLRQG